MPDRFNDVGISAAPAEVAAHALADFFQGEFVQSGRMSYIFSDVTGDPVGRFFQHRHGGHDLARGAVTALESVALHEGGLHRVKLVTIG